MDFFSGPAGVREEDTSTEAPEYQATLQVGNGTSRAAMLLMSGEVALVLDATDS